MTLKLFGHDPSPYVRRTRVLFAELGVPFERDTHGWLDPVGEFLDNSPTGRLPMLDLGPEASERYVYDSRVIAEVTYGSLRRWQAPSSRPKQGGLDVQSTLWNPALEHGDRNVLTVIDEAVGSGINLFAIERDGVPRSAAPYLQRQADRVENCLAWLDKAYAGRTTLTPGTLAYADIALGCGLGWLRFRQRANVDAYPNLVNVEAALNPRESFATTKPV